MLRIVGRSAAPEPEPEPEPDPVVALATGAGGASASPVQTSSTARSRHRCASSAEAITSVVAVGPDGPERTSDDQRGRAWLATREFDTHPSTLARSSWGVTIIPDAPSYRSR